MNDTRDVLQSRRLLITEGPLASVMARLVVPSAIWYLLNYAFFIVDAYFVGKLGTTQLSAMSLICAVLALSLTIAQGMGAALSAITSIYLGAGMQSEATRLVTHTLLLGLLVSIAVGVGGFLTIEPCFRALGASHDQLPFIREFMPFWYAGFAFVLLSTVAQSAIRATGDVKTPLWVLLGTGAVNIALDPVLMSGVGSWPGLGMRGVALAGVIARALAVVIGLALVARRDHLLCAAELRTSVRASWGVIGRIAGPVVMQMGSLALTGAVLLGIAAKLGPEIVAAVGVGLRIDAIASALTLGLAIILPTFIGQNTGAGKPQRAGAGILMGMRQVVLAQTLIAMLVAFAAPRIGSAFSHDPRIQQTITLFLRIVPVGHIAYAMLTASAGTLIALGRMRSYLVIGVAPCLVSIALAWFGSHAWGPVGLIVALPIARASAGILAWMWVSRQLRQTGLLATLPTSA